MKVLVTGATGFIGTSIIPQIIERGYSVRTFSRNPRHGPANGEKIEHFSGDIRDADSVDRAVSECDCVLHLAALMADAEHRPYKEFEAVNVRGSMNVGRACAQYGARFIYGSTALVTGPSGNNPSNETAPLNPGPSKYIRSKAASEAAIQEIKNLSWTILRISPLYGEGMSYGWPETIKRLRAGSFFIPGDATGRLHLTHIDDIVRGLSAAIDVRDGRLKAQTLILGGPEAIEIGRAFSILATELGTPSPRKVPFLPVLAAAYALSLLPDSMRPASLAPLVPYRLRYFHENFVYSTAKARNMLRFKPKISPDSGLRALAMAFRKRTENV